MSRASRAKLNTLFALGLIGLWVGACSGNKSTPTVLPSPQPLPTVVATLPLTHTPPPTATFALLKPSPIQSPLPLPTATSVSASDTGVTWLGKAVKVNAQLAIERPVDWDSNTSLRAIALGVGVINVDAASGAVSVATPPPPVPTEVTPDPRLFRSPNQTYLIQCDEAQIRLYRAVDNQLLSKANIEHSRCDTIQWAMDESAASILKADDGLAYVWRMDGSNPYEIGYTALDAKWAPDSQKLLLEHWTADSDGMIAGVGVTIVDAKGEQISTFPIVARDIDYVDWFTEDVLMSSTRAGVECTAYYYYDSITGKPLGSWARCFDDASLVSQFPALSPNKRWQALDELGYYTLYNLKTKTGYPLVKRDPTYLKFAGWTSDSSTLFLVSRPVTSTSVSDPNTPFGLLALNPFTFQFNLLFKDAMEVIWSPDRRLAFVAFPVRQADDALGVEGGIFNFMTGTMIGRQFVSDRMLYTNPAFGDLIPAAWSHDATQVVFGDSRGNLTLLTSDGAVRSLAMGLPQDSWPHQVRYLWSPDDRYLLVLYDTQAWVVEP